MTDKKYQVVCGMDVHHKNKMKLDNRPENLEAMTTSEHAIHHHNESHAKV